MDGSAVNSLPPSKRFKHLLSQNPTILPAKKRLCSDDHLLLSPTTATAACLPAKKRVWAPPPPSPLKKVENSPTKPKKQEATAAAEDDDGIICAVCGSTDGDPSDPIVFCDGCDLTVHASCYGSPLAHSIPDGDWFCSRCCSIEASGASSPAADCCLCPKPGGAVKPTTDGRWAHILCALLVPEVFFQDPEGREGIDCSEVPPAREDVRCYLCERRSGCGIECSEPKCELGFHVPCAIEEGLCIEYREGRGGAIVAGFCGAHTQLWKKQQLTGKFKIVAREKELKRKARGLRDDRFMREF